MKGSYLGEFQEIVLLAILVLGKEAYGVSIQEEISRRANRYVSRGALHTALSRLSDKGYISSYLGGATAERGGRRKRFFKVRENGNLALTTARELRNKLWEDIPVLSINSK